MDFVNYILLPLNGVCLIGFAINSFSQEALLSAVDPGFLFLYALGFAMIVALIRGLRRRESWAWWLLMLSLFSKAPLGAFARFSPTSDTDAFWGFILGGFLIACLPQLIYFYKRRGLFHVRFGSDQ